LISTAHENVSQLRVYGVCRGFSVNPCHNLG
jgi:hypothetical protein